MSRSYTKKQIEKLQSELRTVIEERDYLKQCCIDTGVELSKHSFEWDGKQKNLVVQALYLNEKYEKLESALKEIKAISDNQKLTVNNRRKQIADKINEVIK